MNTPPKTQDEMLEFLMKENHKVTIFLVSGFQFECVIEAHDKYVIIVRIGENRQMIYKHAISTILQKR